MDLALIIAAAIAVVAASAVAIKLTVGRRAGEPEDEPDIEPDIADEAPEAAPEAAAPKVIAPVAPAFKAKVLPAKDSDPLTGLPNRLLFATQMQTAIRHARERGSCSSLLLIDLDGFKKVNDLHGQRTGDAVLCEIARRLERMLAKNDMLARLGGDEFAVIAEGHEEAQAHRDSAVRLAGQLLIKIKQPIAVEDAKLRIDASIGIALCRPDTTDAELLLRSADRAMVRAKASGRGNFGVFEQRMDDEMREREALENDVMRAIAEDAIQPYFQPIIDIRANRICGFEALARWKHPDRGFVFPDVFIPVVERLGMMKDFTDSILRQVCRSAKSWDGIYVSVNFSASELDDPDRSTRVFQILDEQGFDPKRLEIEITETALVLNMANAQATLAILRAAGVSVCLDDFGTGYASLQQLKNLKFDKLKIDRSFVQAMMENEDCDKIVNAVLGLANSLNLTTVAEGIESLPILANLRNKGCRYGQGFLFGKGVPADLAGKMLGGGHSDAGARSGGVKTR